MTIRFARCSNPIAPSYLEPVFEEIFKGLEQHRLFDHFRMLGDQLLVALDGTTYFSSGRVPLPQLPHPATHERSNPLLSHRDHPRHRVPRTPRRHRLAPEYIMPQDGEAKQDCEQQAGKRWLRKHAQAVAPHQMTLLGDDLYSKQPFCALAQQQGLHFILTCKPDSHPKFYERLAFWQANDGMAEREGRCWNGRFTEVTMYRYINDVLLRGGDNALAVNWFEITVVNAKTGKQRYHNSFITNHRLSADNIAAVAQAGRGRWKIENEHNNVLDQRVPSGAQFWTWPAVPLSVSAQPQPSRLSVPYGIGMER